MTEVKTSKTALIVGMGCLGIAATERLVRDAFTQLIVTNRNKKKAEQSAASIRHTVTCLAVPRIIPLAVDVSESDSISEFLLTLKDTGPGNLDVVLITSGGN